MKLSTKLISSFTALLVLMLALGFISLGEMSSMDKSTSNLATNWLPSVLAVTKLDHLTSLFRRYELLHILTQSQDEMRRYAQFMEEIKASTAETMKRYEALISETEERESYSQFVDA